MTIRCPHCGTEYHVNQAELDSRLTCMVCGKVFIALFQRHNFANNRSKQKLIRNFVESVILLLVLCVVVGGILVWRGHTNRIEAERLELAEKESRMREAERVRETERMKLAEEAKRKEREALARRQREEREAKERLEREKRNNKERYVLYKAVFKENKFDLFVPSVTNDMEKLGGELCYLLPSEESEISFYHVMFETNGMKKVSHLYEDGTLDEVGADEFFGMIKNLEYLVAKEDTVHFRSIKKNLRSGRLSMKGEADPSETFFGMLTPILKSLRPTYDELTFDIYFTPNGDTKKIFVENIPFGASWSFENVRDAVANNTVVKYKVPGGGKKARFKRTVKIWNGSRIKQGVDGITYVPSVMPPQSNHSRWFCNYGGGRIIYRSRITSNNTPERWQVLYDKALQEEQEEAAFYAQQKRFHEASRASAQAKAMEKWQSKVDAVIKDGTLSYTIRKAKVLKDGK